MAGHSKWKNIQHRKGAQDAKRGKIFTKLAKEITVAARLGGGDLESNARLRTVVVKARSNSMPRDNIERAIKKGTGELEAEQYVEKVYEGYGPGGVAVMVECLTDNINRTVADVRHAFTKFGGNLGTEGSVAYQFHKKGTIVYQRGKVKDFDRLFEVALEAGAEDVKEDEDAVEVICAPDAFNALKETLDKMGLEADVADIMRVPENYTALDSDKALSMQKLIDWLEDNDDVQNVYHNAEMPE
ncbi:MAG TPA: YebC/PmpR family DNA-binding transcriptional regulator [Oligoflexus sp.]|uniref:YebC/PmpR family DNA-binding transcriptional regulator n=1 Tax=Oligoflexus sp. TaxID=1971216 RepID=UPI002D7FD946|nr:YebC/PmpR family DNA-binding transcriptional regulator [Oligoflexus sp.]HET9236040.1 YebC/PmpR family DNA-binding transcriptional regulator [Oligoflexus sp.]